MKKIIKHSKEVYDKLVTNFKEDPIVVPTLIYFSHDDPMCHVATMEEMISSRCYARRHVFVCTKNNTIKNLTYDFVPE
jgi:hypothetical protein